MTSKKYQDDLISFIETPKEIAKLMVSLISSKYKKMNDVIILDTGTGRGVFLEELVLNNYTQIEGIELNKTLFKHCNSKYSQIKIYNKDFLDWNTENTYDVIIGNPPYAHFNSLPEKTREKVANIVNNRESDIYYAFIIKAIDLLKEGGELIYIVPYGFFYNTYARIIREKILENGYLNLIIDLDEVRLFEGENPETIIFKFIKKTPTLSLETKIFQIKSKSFSNIQIYQKGLEAIEKMKSNEVFHFHQKPIFASSTKVWTTYPIMKIPNSKPLKELAWVGVGLVSGFEKAFMISDEELRNLNSKEMEFILNCVKAKHCNSFWVEGSTRYFLIKDDIKDENYIKEKLPYYYEKMINWREEMTNRFLPSGKSWFHWQALRNMGNLEKMEDKSKIFVPTLDRSKTNRFSLSQEKVMPSGDVLTVIPLEIDSFYLLGYLNSNFFRKYYLSAGARRGNRIAFTQRIMSNINIPRFKEEIEVEISIISQKIYESKNLNAKKKIDSIIEEAIMVT